MFRESEQPQKKTPKGPFSYDLVPKAQKSIKSYLRELFQSWLAGVFLFHKYSYPNRKRDNLSSNIWLFKYFNKREEDKIAQWYFHI